MGKHIDVAAVLGFGPVAVGGKKKMKIEHLVLPCAFLIRYRYI